MDIKNLNISKAKGFPQDKAELPFIFPCEPPAKFPLRCTRRAGVAQAISEDKL